MYGGGCNGQPAAKQADLVLVMNIHSDYLDTAAIACVRKAGALVGAPLFVGIQPQRMRGRKFSGVRSFSHRLASHSREKHGA
jgi:L-ascorbate metabolism protein UlaG (beta-lactamase superfamily)